MTRWLSLAVLLLCALSVPLHASLIGRDLYVTPLFLALLYAFLVSVAVLMVVGIVSGVRWAAAVRTGRLGAFRRRFLPPVAAAIGVSGFLLVSAVSVQALIAEPVMVRFLTALLPVLLLLPHTRYRLPVRVCARLGVLAAALLCWGLLPPAAASAVSWVVVAVSAALCATAVRRSDAGLVSRVRPRRVLLGVFLPMAAVFSLVFLAGYEPRPDAFARENVVYGPLLPSWQGAPTTLFYDLKVCAEEGRLYVSDFGCGARGQGNVGYVELVTGRMRLSGYSYRELQQIVLDARETLPEASPRRLLFVWARGGVLTLARDTLEVLHRFPDLPSVIELTATPTARYLAALVEWRPKVYWIDADTWAWNAYWVPVLVPYQVLCSGERRRCYVSGWWHTTHLAEVRVGDDGLPAGTRRLFLGPYSLGMTLVPGQDRLLVLRPLAGSLDVIDTESFRRVRRIRIPPLVRALAYWPEADIVFLPEYYAGTVHLLRLGTGEPVGRFQVGRQVRDLLWDDNLESLFLLDEQAVYRFTPDALVRRFPGLASPLVPPEAQQPETAR